MMKYRVKNTITNEESVVHANNVGHALKKATYLNKWTHSQRLVGEFKFKNYEVIPQFDVYTQKVTEPGVKYGLVR